ncbi:hypothetical protein EAG_05411 [Camponotus floridanus]|uniref:Double jelly roll-like domain-containing protein n=1 Tax=Camponotus floridanus TaxID=104421 RepID=E2A1Z1_CAMFO|nr:hypothetical protein EAG_05411 [Camponotus floridanus]
MFILVVNDSDILGLGVDQLQYVPKKLLLDNNSDFVDRLWDKLPMHLKDDPDANTIFGYSDEIRIPIQQQDLYMLSCESFLYVEGRLQTKKNPPPPASSGESGKPGSTSKEPSASLTSWLVNNCVAFMFEEIRYELDGVEIDLNRNVRITSTIKNYASLTAERDKILKNDGWDLTARLSSVATTGDFNFCEIAILANGRDLMHHFCAPILWNLLTKSEKSQACWLTLKHHEFHWTDGYVEYRHVKEIIHEIYRASRDLESNAAVMIYVKGHEKKKWLTDIAGEIAEQRDLTIESIDVDYEDIGPLRTLASTCIYRCAYHAKNCALENVCKLHNWWLERRDQLRDITSFALLSAVDVLSVLRVLRVLSVIFARTMDDEVSRLRRMLDRFRGGARDHRIRKHIPPALDAEEKAGAAVILGCTVVRPTVLQEMGEERA